MLAVCSVVRSLKPRLLLSVVLLGLFAQLGRAQDPLQYFKSYFVTGDYAVAGVGLYGQGVNGYATGTITMSGVPCTTGGPGPGTTLAMGPALAACMSQVAPLSATSPVPAQPIAAFLIWQTLE